VRDAWDEFASVPEGDLALADHLELHAEVLTSTVGDARARATAALSDRDDAWGPLAARISTWCEAWDDCLAKSLPSDWRKAAETLPLLAQTRRTIAPVEGSRGQRLRSGGVPPHDFLA